jgi:acetyl-CoA carboxylase/biotin carboxylase 1
MSNPFISPGTPSTPTQFTQTYSYRDVISQYVNKRGGKRVIEKILIANNGIAAVKAIRSMRKWAFETFGSAQALRFVVMATPEDIQANQEYVRLADELVQVPGEGNFNNFANVKLIVDIAERTSCDAVWPGWGHASENPELPQSLNNSRSKIIFIGPSPHPMHMLGDKITSSIIAESAKVPTLPWSGSGLRVNIPTTLNEVVDIPEKVFEAACIHDEQEAMESAKKIGYPIMIKASEGGGGKGIRKVHDDNEMRLGYQQVKQEVPGSPIFLMKLAHPSSRHLEVQVIADEYNNAIALYSRDCSVQRRHQKIIEEGPVTVAKRNILVEMEKAAVRLARSVRYSCAGTVEYLYDAHNDAFYFLELNPRLQVEHPVTEWITHTNIPSIQLQICMGIPLYAIPEIRAFMNAKDPLTSIAPIDFDKATPRQPDGHVIACRITAENPEEGFQPTCGSVVELNFRNTPDIWGYFSIRSQGGIHAYSDSQFGHIFAHGKTRDEARQTMITALQELSIRGDIRTTQEYLITLLKHEAFANNKHDTSWLDGLIKEKIAVEKPNNLLTVLCGALHTIHRIVSDNCDKWCWFIERGQQPAFELLQTFFPIDLILNGVKYSMIGTWSGSNRFTFAMNGSFMEAEIKVLRDGALLVLIDQSSSHISYATEDPNGLRVSVDGRVCIFTKEFDPSQIRAKVSGKLVRYLVQNHEHVEANSPIAELEVMKMIITVYTPLAGLVQRELVEGSTVNQGDILATLELDDKSQIQRSILFDGKFPEQISHGKTNVYQEVKQAVQLLTNILSGYDYPAQLFEDKLREAISVIRRLSDRTILVHQFVEQMSVLRKSIPSAVLREVNQLLQLGFYSVIEGKKHDEIVEVDSQLMSSLRQCFLNYADNNLQGTRREEFLQAIKPLFAICDLYDEGYKKYAFQVLSQLAEQYLQVERIFDTIKRREAVWLELREKYQDNMSKTFSIALSQTRLQKKNKVIVALLTEVEKLDLVTEFLPLLNEFSSLISKNYGDVVLKAKHILMRSRLPSFKKMQQEMESILVTASQIEDNNARYAALQNLISKSNYSFDILMTFFSHDDIAIRDLAAEVYIRKAYTAFEISDVNIKHNDNFKTVEFKFLSKESATTGAVSSLSKSDGIVGSISYDALSSLVSESEDAIGFGVMVIFKSLDDVRTHLSTALEVFGGNKDVEHTSILKIFLPWNPEENTQSPTDSEVVISRNRSSSTASSNIPSDQEMIRMLTDILKKHQQQLEIYDIKRVTVVIDIKAQLPLYFTFRQRMDYQEDPMYRHIEPTLAFQLFLRKMSNYNITPFPYKDPTVHVYYGVAKKQKKASRYDFLNRRFFVRTVVLQGDIFTLENPEEFQISEAERYLVSSLNALELAMADSRYEQTYANHIFINFLPEVVVKTDMVAEIINRFQNYYASRLWPLRVSEVEVKLNAKTSPDASVIPLRFIATNKTGYKLTVDMYQEVKDPLSGKVKYSAFYGKSNALHGMDVNHPHPLLEAVPQKRRIAHNNDTSYVYDYPYLFERAIRKIWKDYAKVRNLNPRVAIPKVVIVATEYVLNEAQDALVPIPFQIGDDSSMGNNKCGMICWRFNLKTPEYVNGREIIVIANDITFQSGSFGPAEDIVFNLASEMARREKLPRIYIAANSGARIGLASEVKDVFRVEWNDSSDPSKGFKYLYILDKDYQRIKGSVNVEKIDDEKWKIIDVIGEEDGIGVENLRGSGMIAGETSRAYEQIFTINYVAARSVGIGAYLNRLGQRIIQNRKAPILLTGAPALNKVLARDVYTSNLQLGGVQIMHPNGVSHLVTNDDLRAISKMLKWLSYVPAYATGPLPIISPIDSIDREIAFVPTRDSVVDPRGMLAGIMKDDEFVSGFFDKDSFFETLTGWAKNIVVGRARLGGIPVGCIAVDTRTLEQVIPADPADTSSRERVVQKSGQVWFPDSAYKTAQAIRDFNHGEELPLFIFANWRGFSGGQRDMFEEVLKFGSYIVDALVEYRHPVFVYIPPYGELRGGAWVVVDPSINPNMMSMYADEKAKGGILEPSGIVEVKFKKEDIISTAMRIDEEYQKLANQLPHEQTSTEKKRIQDALKKREQALLPIYTHIAETFADLHDTPGRMKAKEVISDIVQWKHARKFFYWRLRRKINEVKLFARIDQESSIPRTQKEKTELLRQWMGQLSSDQDVVKWYEDNANVVESHIKSLRQEKISANVSDLLKSDADTVVTTLLHYLNNQAEGEVRKELQKKIRDQLNLAFNF